MGQRLAVMRYLGLSIVRSQHRYVAYARPSRTHQGGERSPKLPTRVNASIH
jgi:hypothetical protein